MRVDLKVQLKHLCMKVCGILFPFACINQAQETSEIIDYFNLTCPAFETKDEVYVEIVDVTLEFSEAPKITFRELDQAGAREYRYEPLSYPYRTCKRIKLCSVDRAFRVCVIESREARNWESDRPEYYQDSIPPRTCSRSQLSKPTQDKGSKERRCFNWRNNPRGNEKPWARSGHKI